MFLDLLFASPLIALAWIAAILIALTVHEFSHALVGRARGDRTAEREGRMTLNPISHIDPIGFGLLLLFGFGWAKPVPYNPYNLRDPKWDSVKIALAGPISNLLLAALAAFAIRALMLAGGLAYTNLLVIFLFLTLLVNLFLAFFNLIPIHPLDGSKLAVALLNKPEHRQILEFLLTRGPQILMVLVFISLLTPFNVFFFVTGPSYAMCDVLLGDSCQAGLSRIFLGL